MWPHGQLQRQSFTPGFRRLQRLPKQRPAAQMNKVVSTIDNDPLVLRASHLELPLGGDFKSVQVSISKDTCLRRDHP